MIAHGIDYSTTKRRRFTISDRLAIVRNVRRRIATGESIRGACKALNIIPKQYREWSKSTEALTGHANPNAKSTAPDNDSALKPIKEDLLRFIFELREQGIAVSISLVAIQAARLMPEFKEKPSRARYQSAIRLWIRKHGLVHRMGTHEYQRAPSETSGMARDYVETSRPRLSQSNRHQDFLLNMDQTPIPFTFHAKKTIESVGVRTVHIRKSTNDTKMVTCAMTVSASGKVLTPLLVFNGAPNGRIKTKEFGTYPPDMENACQGNAWMDEQVMHLWIDKVLKPYVDQAPPGVVPLLLLDSYRCHMMKATVNAIEDLGVQVEHIPGGCTSLCQPVDVGVNKPFKSRMRNLWEEWMLSTSLLNVDGKVTPPTYQNAWYRMDGDTESTATFHLRHHQCQLRPPLLPPTTIWKTKTAVMMTTVPIVVVFVCKPRLPLPWKKGTTTAAAVMMWNLLFAVVVLVVCTFLVVVCKPPGLLQPKRTMMIIAAAVMTIVAAIVVVCNVQEFVVSYWSMLPPPGGRRRNNEPPMIKKKAQVMMRTTVVMTMMGKYCNQSPFFSCAYQQPDQNADCCAASGHVDKDAAGTVVEEQGATYDEEESTSNDEDNSDISDDDDDDKEVMQSEPLCSCAYQQPDQNAY